MNLFQTGDFALHSGGRSGFKIECDALTEDDWQALAWLASRLCRFGRAIGVPRGGTRLAHALAQYATTGPVLLVDDVLTTGRSMEDYRQRYPDSIGLVVFARGKCPEWITPLFQLAEGL